MDKKELKSVGAHAHRCPNKGITLIALIITIIVMLILVAVTITTAINGGLFEKAGEAVGDTQNAINKEQKLADGKIQVEGLWYDSIDDYLAGNYSSVTNPYDEDGWVMAWTCTDGIWSDTIQAGEAAEGDIVAKLYETGNKITPPDFLFVDMWKIITFPEGNEYHLVIEGEGEMPPLAGRSEQTEAYGWQTLTFAFIMDQANNSCIMPYVTEITICDGITNIGDYAFVSDTGLRKITISNSVKRIGASSFWGCRSLTNLKIPINVTSIEDGSFYCCEGLTSLIIPKSVTSLGDAVFEDCSLESITYQGTQVEWNRVSMGVHSLWNVKTVVCTDGEITL